MYWGNLCLNTSVFSYDGITWENTSLLATKSVSQPMASTIAFNAALFPKLLKLHTSIKVEQRWWSKPMSEGANFRPNQMLS